LRALITGASGFVANYLARELSASGWHVDGSSFDPEGKSEWVRRTGDGFSGRFDADVADASAMRSVLTASAPDAVFHLAGVSSVTSAERDPESAFAVNCVGAVVLLREIVAFREKTGKDPVCLVVGSAEQYGKHARSSIPLSEEASQRPVTVYAASKCAQEIAALQMYRAHHLKVICVRAFTHSGPGQGAAFLLPSLIRRAAALAGKINAELPVGNTSPVRDYLHVEDVVRAYRLLVERGAAGEVYNVCSGTGLSVEQMARKILARLGVSAVLKERADLVRPVDIPVLIGDNTKLSRATGWRPTKSFDELIEDLVLAASK
jgi:GDP-4-dehydro-6-deoxy-D-mannose reductase